MGGSIPIAPWHGWSGGGVGEVSPFSVVAVCVVWAFLVGSFDLDGEREIVVWEGALVVSPRWALRWDQPELVKLWSGGGARFGRQKTDARTDWCPKMFPGGTGGVPVRVASVTNILVRPLCVCSVVWRDCFKCSIVISPVCLQLW